MKPSITPKQHAKNLQRHGATLTEQILALRAYEKNFGHVLKREDAIWLRITIPNLIALRKKQLESEKAKPRRP